MKQKGELAKDAGALGASLTAGGGFLSFLSIFAPYALIMLILGIVLVVAAYGFKMGSAKSRPWFGIGGIVMLLIASIVMFVPTGGLNGDGDGVGVDGARWIISIPQTEQGGGRDAAAEIFNDAGSDFSLDCTADTPDGTLDAEGTNLFFVRDSKRAEIQITMDDDAATSAAGFSAPDCHSNDFYAQPESPIDVNKDGNADNQLLWGRVVNMGRTSVSDGNLTANPTLFYTAAEGPYVSWMMEDADQTGAGAAWITACPNAIGQTSFAPTDCNTWRYLGDTTGAGFYVAFAWLWQSDTPPWYYTSGYIGESFDIVIEFGHGSAGNVQVDYTFTYTVQLIVRT